MKWFKHYSNASKGEVLQELCERFGEHKGYSLYFRFVEYLSDKWDGCSEPTFKIREKDLRKAMIISSKPLREFAEILSRKYHESVTEVSRICHFHFTFESEFCHISFPKLAEILHKDSISARLRPASGGREEEEEKEKDPPKSPKGTSSYKTRVGGPRRQSNLTQLSDLLTTLASRK